MLGRQMRTTPKKPKMNGVSGRLTVGGRPMPASLSPTSLSRVAGNPRPPVSMGLAGLDFTPGQRYRAEGEAAFEPRSRRRHTSPTRLPQTTIDLNHGLTVSADSIHRHLHAPRRQQFPVCVFARVVRDPATYAVNAAVSVENNAVAGLERIVVNPTDNGHHRPVNSGRVDDPAARSPTT